MKIKKLLCLTLAIGFMSCNRSEKLPEFTLTGKVTTELNPMIFGQFFEKASWEGEIGADAVISLKTGNYLPEAIEYMKMMNIPVLRYPGGTDIDYYPWYNLIDNVPGKHSHRPAYRFRNTGPAVSDNRMGFHEYFALCDSLNIEPLVVINLGEAYFKRQPIAKAAREMAADLVAYCNATSGKWAEVRAKNGHPKPFNVTYFQIGNEPWLYGPEMKFDKPMDPAILNHYATCVDAYIDAMRAVDSSIVIIADGSLKALGQAVKEKSGNKINMLTYHSYMPWQISKVEKDSITLSSATLSPQQVWQAMVATPQLDTASGVAVLDNGWYNEVVKLGYPIAVTEWNWNGWFIDSLKALKPEHEYLAKGIGVAGYLHAMMREGANIQMGCQSMLAGTAWNITGIRIDTTEQKRPTMFPSAIITGLYSRYHGNHLLELVSQRVQVYEQPFKLGGLEPMKKVAVLDVLATSNDSTVFVHVINRSYDSDQSFIFDFGTLIVQSDYTHRYMSVPGTCNYSQLACLYENKRSGAKSKLRLSVPKQSVSIFEFKVLR